MTKRVRVLKEMPFAKKGDILCKDHFIDDFKVNINNTIWEIKPHQVDYLMKCGWLEYVEEDKSLHDKFAQVYCEKKFSNREVDVELVNRFLEIAKEHYLEAFDKAIPNSDSVYYEVRLANIDILRKAIEEG